MEKNQEHRVPRWNQFWNRMRGDIGVRKVHGRRNRGFSLVELIIVIAIMAILAAGIAPALIRYINKARKADDIAAAETIGTTFRAAITSEEMLYEWVNACVAPGSLNPNWKDGRDYRIVAYSNVPTAAGFAPSDFHLLPLGSLQPEGVSNLLVAGRPISADEDAFAGVRIQATCMETGEAAGLATALCVQKGNLPLDSLDITEVVRRIREGGTILPLES